MKKTTLPNNFANKLIPLDGNGKPIVALTTLKPYIKDALQFLKNNQKSMSTADFVDALIESLAINLDEVLDNTALISALLQSLTLDYHPQTCVDDTIYCIVKDWLREQDFYYTKYIRYKAIVTADYLMVSKLNPKKIAVWRNTSKMGDWDRRQTISVRKWIGSTLTDLTAEQAESLAKRIDEHLASLIELDVCHHSSYEFDAWERAYSSNKIRSCMSTFSDSEVGNARTFTCFCTGYHGLPDNGLKLTVLYQKDVPVARAITFDDGDTKCYIATYGDSRLSEWLHMNNYIRTDFLEDTILYSDDDMLKPFVDGDDIIRGDHCVSDDGIYYWILSDYGEYALGNTKAYASNGIECDSCDEVFGSSRIREYISSVDGKRYNICDRCFEIDEWFTPINNHP